MRWSGDVHVISHQASTLKSDKTLKELAERDDELGSWARDYLAATAA
jgi:hypothetical protein